MELMYHYTSLSTLQCLLDNISNNHEFIFHASSIYSMNDSQEFIHGYNVVLDWLKKYEEEQGIKENRLSEIWDNYLENHTKEEFNSLFIEKLRQFGIRVCLEELQLPTLFNAYWQCLGLILEETVC